MKKNKLAILILFASIICLSIEKQSFGQNSLEKTIFEVLESFKEKDTVKINRLIYDQFGVYVIFRRGVFDEFEKTKIINFKESVPDYLPYPEFELINEIKFESLPKYDCETESWNKTGLFVDTTLTNNLLSETAKNLVKFRNDEIETYLINRFVEIEENSLRIILADRHGGEFVFYLTEFDKKWFLTIIDRVSSDCGS